MLKFFTRIFFVVLVVVAAKAQAQTTITQWNFNSNPADANTSTGSIVASTGTGTIESIGGIAASFASGSASGGSSDPAPSADNTGWGLTTWPAQGTSNKTAGIQFKVSTVGFQNIIVTFDLRHSNTGPRHVQFQYTLDVTATTPVWVDFAVDAATGGDTWFARSYNLSAVTGLNNNANAGFRAVAAFEPSTTAYAPSNTANSYATTGTWRFDMVTVKGNSTSSDVTAPVAQSYQFKTATSSFIKFSEPVSTATATNVANYVFAPSLAVSAATLSASGDTVFLTHAPFVNGQPYTVTVAGVQDLAANAMSSTVFNTIFNSSTPNLVITEIIHSPNDIESIEVYNAGTTAIPLGGLKWTDGTGGSFPVTNLAAGATAVFATAPTTTSSTLGVPTVYTITAGLGSGNDILVIRNSLEQVVDSVAYFVGTNGWPAAVSGVYAYSFELNAATNDNNLGSNWIVPANTVTPQPSAGIVRATPGVYPAPPVAPATATVSFTATKASVNENGGTVNIVANLQNGGASPSSIDIELLPIGTATSGTDFTLPASLKFQWPANSNNVTSTITVTINNDALAESTEYFVVRMVNPVNIVTPAAATNNFTVFINDDDKQAPVASQSIKLNHIASFSNGVAGTNSAEIVAHDPTTQRLFIANSIGAKLDIVNFSNPSSASLISSISMAPYGNINSVAVKNGIVALAIENAAPQSPGKIVFLNTNGVFISQVDAGAMPDMITFNHAGTKVITSNEGEPNTAYTSDPEGSITIVDISGGVASVTNANVTTASFTGFNGQAASLKAAGIRLFGPNTTVAQDLEPEYITISDDDQTAWVTCQENNAIATVNIATATVTQLRPLGKKDHALAGNALDVSDQGTDIQIANWPIKGLYMPDAISSYTVGGQTYLVTANEGDSREYTGYSEIVRLSATTYILDPTVFPYADAIKANLGRLNVTTASGDTDGDGDFDEIHAFGSRSFSIWNATTGALVWDSKDEMETIIAKHPTWGALFNASNANNTLKNRSDDKGPEPEGVTVAQIAGRTFAFLALERIGGCMVYDITDPTAPTFVDYKNTRTVATYGGDNGAEGIVFINATNSPTGSPIVILANEISSTLSFFAVDATSLNITLENITARNEGKSNIIKWNTADEAKGDMFELERSKDGTSFSTLATINAHGAASSYSYEDKQPFNGWNHYRLKMKHIDGQISYSKIVAANVGNVLVDVKVSPNPFKDKLVVTVTGRQPVNARVEMFDAKGMLLKSARVSGRETYLNVGALPAGTYMVRYSEGRLVQTMVVTK